MVRFIRCLSFTLCMLSRNLLLSVFASVVLAAVSLSSCRKENGIDNNQVIQTPYSLFVSDSAGGLKVTNDGETYREIFRPDGLTDRGILTSGSNVLWAKNRVYLSQNNEAFNPTFNTLDTSVKWASMLLRSDKQKRVYVPSTIGSGIYYSEDNGRSWQDDTTFLGGGRFPASTFAETNDGVLYAYDNQNRRAAIRLSATTPWALIGSSTALPTSGSFQLIGYQKTLVAYDYSGSAGAWYTTDSGQNWKQFTDIPAGERLRCAVVPFGDNLLIGSESGKVYRFNNGTFVASSEGIETGSIVRGLAAKTNIFKADGNGNSRENRYVFAATSTGIYRSEDGGLNWVKMIRGDYQNIY